MLRYNALRGPRLRRHRRFLRDVQRRGALYVRAEHEFRMAERLHREGLLTACVSKLDWISLNRNRPFRELAVFATEAVARRHYDQILPRLSRH